MRKSSLGCHLPVHPPKYTWMISCEAEDDETVPGCFTRNLSIEGF